MLIELKQAISLMQEARIKLELEQLLSLPVDIISYRLGDDLAPFYLIARLKAVPLEDVA